MPQSITISCAGYEIAADWYEGTRQDKILLDLPGYTSKKSREQYLAGAIVQATGASALVIDYSGHGDSPFELRDTRPAQHFLEVIYAFEWIKTRYPQAEIWVTGTSYGGFLATQLTKYRSFDKLILRAPAIYKPEAFYDLWAKRLDDEAAYTQAAIPYRRDSETLATHPLLARASKFEGKSLVVVHGKDEIVPPETTDAYIKAFNAVSILAEDIPHSINAAKLPEAELQVYLDTITEWLN